MRDYWYPFRHNKRVDTTFISAKMERFGFNEAHLFTSATPHDDDPDELNRFGRPLLNFAAAATILIMIVGICGNLLTVIALLKCPKVRNVAAAFIISLCIADCLFCVIVLPFSAYRFIRGTWLPDGPLCQIIPFLQYGNVGVSLLCIAMITINRYIMITHHSSYARIYKTQWITVMIVFSWVFAYGMQLPTLFGVWGVFKRDDNLGTCSIMQDKNGHSSKTTLFVTAFVFPCIIIIGCYTRIFWVVHKSEQRMRQHASKQNAIPNNLRVIQSSKPIATKDTNKRRSNTEVAQASTVPIPAISTGTSNQPATEPNAICSENVSVNSRSDSGVTMTVQPNKIPSGKFTNPKPSRVKDARDAKAKRNEWRITKMVLAIFLSFVMCYLPITVAKIADKDVSYPTLHIIGYILLYLSSCINPIIYVIMNKQYRQAYKTVILCKPGRLLAFTQAGSSVGEKWKDAAFSYNHRSVTMVSQVSLPEELQSSCPNHQQHRRDSPHPRRLPDIRGSTDP
ncbi:G-protein coupled receptor moody isoform X2 [Sitodiplosis mosellana]|uniref:G-protein coupled receptor moody isoform X2 n=1 Tax=Sitodiplosis mosellana TaxID=263140 RepID=UPI002443EC8D|nr:G-protein coupled receptor moody isoform X2 [Sitodiplosis mosellana]